MFEHLSISRCRTLKKVFFCQLVSFLLLLALLFQNVKICLLGQRYRLKPLLARSLELPLSKLSSFKLLRLSDLVQSVLESAFGAAHSECLRVAFLDDLERRGCARKRVQLVDGLAGCSRQIATWNIRIDLLHSELTNPKTCF